MDGVISKQRVNESSTTALAPCRNMIVARLRRGDAGAACSRATRGEANPSTGVGGKDPIGDWLDCQDPSCACRVGLIRLRKKLSDVSAARWTWEGVLRRPVPELPKSCKLD